MPSERSACIDALRRRARLRVLARARLARAPRPSRAPAASSPARSPAIAGQLGLVRPRLRHLLERGEDASCSACRRRRSRRTARCRRPSRARWRRARWRAAGAGIARRGHGHRRSGRRHAGQAGRAPCASPGRGGTAPSTSTTRSLRGRPGGGPAGVGRRRARRADRTGVPVAERRALSGAPLRMLGIIRSEACGERSFYAIDPERRPAA